MTADVDTPLRMLSIPRCRKSIFPSLSLSIVSLHSGPPPPVPPSLHWQDVHFSPMLHSALLSQVSPVSTVPFPQVPPPVTHRQLVQFSPALHSVAFSHCSLGPTVPSPQTSIVS